jgi:hypothetical protein
MTVHHNSATAVCRGGLVDTRTDLRALLMLAASVSISWVFAKCVLWYHAKNRGVTVSTLDTEHVLMLTLPCALLQVHSQCVPAGRQLWHCWSCRIHGEHNLDVRASVNSRRAHVPHDRSTFMSVLPPAVILHVLCLGSIRCLFPAHSQRLPVTARGHPRQVVAAYTHVYRTLQISSSVHGSSIMSCC